MVFPGWCSGRPDKILSLIASKDGKCDGVQCDNMDGKGDGKPHGKWERQNDDDDDTYTVLHVWWSHRAEVQEDKLRKHTYKRKEGVEVWELVAVDDKKTDDWKQYMTPVTRLHELRDTSLHELYSGPKA